VAELALVGLPAAGALLAALLRRRRRLAALVGLLLGLLAAASVAAVQVLPAAGHALAPASQLVILATFASGAFAVAFVPRGADRLPLLIAVLAGLAAALGVSLVQPAYLAAVVVLAVAAVQASLPGIRSFGERLRGPAFGGVLILLGAALALGAANTGLSRLAGLGFVLGVTATIGLAPYGRPLDPQEPPPASAIAWLGFLGPAVLALLATRLLALVPAAGGEAFGALLVALGLFNAGVGALGAILSREPADRWRHSFLADWGLALIAFGMLDGPAVQAAFLLLLSILLLRLPLYLLARPVLVRGVKPGGGALNLIAAVALAGGAPFTAFAARILLIRGTVTVAWPLTALLILLMLAWLPASVRLVETLDLADPRTRRGVLVVLAVNLAAGLFPAPLLAAVSATLP
jgi:hypothetical protein